MSGIFLKFKRRRNAIRIVRASMVGASVGLVAAGVWLILSKLTVIDFEPITSAYVGVGAMLLCGLLVFLFSGISDIAFAEELDSLFGLKARVQTMVAYSEEESVMLSMQREDAEKALSAVPLKAYKFKRVWIYIIALVLSMAVLGSGFLVTNLRGYVPPEEVIPFKLSEMQEEGLLKLISDVETSEDIEEEFKLPMAAELKALLEELRVVETQPDMLAVMEVHMSAIRDITYESSTATEILNGLWDSNNVYLRHLAKALDTSSVASLVWADFAEGLRKYAVILMGDDKNPEELDSDDMIGKALLDFAIDTMSLKLKGALDSTGLTEADEIYAAIIQFFESDPGGLNLLQQELDGMDDAAARKALLESFELTGKALYDAISLNKKNADKGEYVMMRLSALFGVPLPEFERPEFVKKGLSVGGDEGRKDEDKDDAPPGGGGIGEGAVYGSDDMVLDPRTGEYVKYGTLIDEYFAIMLERLEGDSYTEEQKEAIKKYFSLLYSGFEEE